jgi:hypothetical protein
MLFREDGDVPMGWSHIQDSYFRNHNVNREISGSHGGKYEDCYLLGSCLMMVAANTSERLVNFYQATRRNNPE